MQALASCCSGLVGTTDERQLGRYRRGRWHSWNPDGYLLPGNGAHGFSSLRPTAALAVHPTIDSSDLEFVEILNKNNSSVDLTNWRLRGGIDFDFPAGTTLDAGGVLVITSFNPDSVANASRSSAFRTHYGINGNIRLIGGYAQQLDNDDELVKLQRPDTPPLEDPTFIPRLQEDALLYDDLAPWPTSPDSTGTTLQRSDPNHWASDSTSWLAAVASPGSFGGSLPGDFNGDQIVNDVDIDLLFAAVHSVSTDGQFDLDASGVIDASDVTLLVETILGTRFGDNDTDGDVDTRDLTTAIINFNSADGSGKSWIQGDTDGDGDVDTRDLTRSIINFTGALAVEVARAANSGVDSFDRSFGLVALKELNREIDESFTIAKTDTLQNFSPQEARTAEMFTRRTREIPRSFVSGSTPRSISKRSVDDIFAEKLDWPSGV